VVDPERALIRNTATGETIIGALFRRERENPGPLLQISSDVAEELGILPGAPTELYVVALRREEVTVETEGEAPPEANPVVADLATPVNVEATPLDPIEGAAAAIDAAESAAAPAAAAALPAATAVAGALVPAADTNTSDDVVEVNLPPAEPALPDDTAPIAQAPIDLPAATSGPQFQIGIFSVQANAEGAASSVIAQQAGGRTVWAVISSPVDDDVDATLARIKEVGFIDAVLLETPS